jgi:hypothetical protein
MTQKEAVKLLDDIIKNSNKRINELKDDDKFFLVSKEIYTALNSCFDWRKEEGLKFKGDKIFYKGIQIKQVL